MSAVWKPENQKHRGQKIDLSAHAVRRRTNASFLCLLVLFRPSMNWMMPAHIEKGNLLYSAYWSKCIISSRNPFTDTCRNNVWPGIWTFCDLVKWPRTSCSLGTLASGTLSCHISPSGLMSPCYKKAQINRPGETWQRSPETAWRGRGDMAGQVPDAPVPLTVSAPSPLPASGSISLKRLYPKLLRRAPSWNPHPQKSWEVVHKVVLIV